MPPATSAGSRSESAAARGTGVGVPVAALAVAVVVFMQIGTVARPLGDLGPTRTADWLDLLTPWAVVGAAGWVLLRCRRLTGRERPDVVSWGLLAAGGVAFAEGKGLHLAGNSVGNADPVGRVADVAHLWDEAVGHWLWYLGLLLVLAAVVRTVVGRSPALLRTTAVGLVLAVLTGFSLANTWIEGQTPWLGLVAAAGFTAWGLRNRARGGIPVAVAAGVALLQLAGWGLYWWLTDGLVYPEYYDVFDWL